LLLRYTDQLWKDHLLALDRLRQGVGLRGYGQRNPLLEYKREALQMYRMMSAMRDEQVLRSLFNTEVELAQAAAANPGKQTARRLPEVGGSPKRAADVFRPPAAAAPAQAPAAPPEVRQPLAGDEARAFAAEHGIKRNEPCPCGSGKKLKKCCGARGAKSVSRRGGGELRG